MSKFKFLAPLMAAAALVPAMGSCTKDDAPDGPNSSEVSDMDGTRVTSIGGTQIRYDDEGRAYRFRNSYGEEIEIDYSKKKIFIKYYDEEETMDVKFNGKGFITEISSSWDFKEDDCQVKGSGKLTLSYDKNNCLTTMKVSSSETEKDLSDKSTSKYSEETTQKFKWTKGDLVNISYETTEIEDGEKERYSGEVEVDYSFTENKFRQFPMSLVYDMEGDYDIFFAVGLMGNGPVDFPEKMYVTEDGESDRTYSIRFDLNDNGSIATEYMGYTSISYGYSNITRSDFGAGDRMGHFTPRTFFRLSRRTR